MPLFPHCIEGHLQRILVATVPRLVRIPQRLYQPMQLQQESVHIQTQHPVIGEQGGHINGSRYGHQRHKGGIMATDTLEIFGTEYSGVTGIKATDENSNTKTYIRPQGTKSITANGNGIDVTEYASVDVAVPGSSPNLQTKTKTYTPTTSQQTETVSADAGYDGLQEVGITVNAMPSATDGTPTASKGAVNNHSIAVTPSVTNTTGYITGSTKTGTAVTVSASELVSGSQTITTNNTYDVTNLSSVTVNVSGGGSKNVQIAQSTSRASSRKASP